MGFRIEFKTLDEMTSREAFLLFKLRVDVFVGDQGFPFREIDDADGSPDTLHVLAWDGADFVGCARIFPTSEGAKFGRFVVAPAARGTGLGHEIMHACIAKTERWPGDLVLEAQSGLTDYYGQFGFEVEGEEFLDTGMPHRFMRLRR